MIPSERYQQDLADRVIASDPNQKRVIKLFDKLYRNIKKSNDDTPSIVQKLTLLFSRSRSKEDKVKGIYLWGGVGRGKTYLMDLFFECLPIDQKERTHFYRFMQSVHKDLSNLKRQKNPLETVAADIANRTRVLCFDELFVLDIGDAMILAGLMEALFKNGVILVATSNIHPNGLYENGLQREKFLPAIGLIKQNTEVVQLEGEVDYRLRSLSQATLYHCPADASSEVALLKSFHELVPNRSDIETSGSITILDRDIETRCHAEDVAWFDFDAICDGPRSAFDYVEIAKIFHALIVSGVPKFDEAMNDKARRFVNLVDELYDRRVKLLISAGAEITDLYQGESLSFEFKRTASRLLEMQSYDYLSSGHLA